MSKRHTLPARALKRARYAIGKASAEIAEARTAKAKARGERHSRVGRRALVEALRLADLAEG